MKLYRLAPHYHDIKDGKIIRRYYYAEKGKYHILIARDLQNNLFEVIVDPNNSGKMLHTLIGTVSKNGYKVKVSGQTIGLIPFEV